MLPSRLAACLVGTCAALGAASAAAAPAYRLTILPPVDGSVSFANAINDRGQVVGHSEGSGMYATIWNEATASKLPGLEGRWSNAMDINDAGTIVGEASTADDVGHAVVWNGNGAVRLKEVDSSKPSGAWAINDKGQIAGYSASHATLWNSPNTVTVLGSDYSAAVGINHSGKAVGYFEPPGSNTVAMTWQGASATPLDTADGFLSFATAVNNHGTIAGWTLGNHQALATVWHGSKATQLGTLGGATTQAYSINDAGDVVGFSTYLDSFPSGGAVIWKCTQAIDLNTLIDPADAAIFTLIVAADINNHGQIVGYGWDADRRVEAFLLTPIPEPSGYALTLAGIAMVGVATRQRRKGRGNSPLAHRSR